MLPNELGRVIPSTYGPGHIPSDLLIYDRDRAGALLWKKKGTTKFMSMINTRFSKRRVSSFTPTWYDIDEMDHLMTLVEDQADTDDGFTKLVLTNEQGLQLQTGDLLSVQNVFLADGYASGTAGTYSRTWATTTRELEQVLVISNPEADNAGSGKCFVRVRRGYINDYASGQLMSQPTRSAAGLLKSGDEILHMGNVQATGSDAPRGVTRNIEVDSNPLQIMRWAFEAEKEVEYERNFLSERPIDINQKLALNNMAYQFEFRALFNRPVKEQIEGKWRYAMGGMFNYITSYIDYSDGGNVTNMDWFAFQNNVMKPIFDAGGSQSKIAFTSIDVFTALATMLWNKITLTVNEKWSQEFGFEIFRIAGGGGELNIVPSWVYGRSSHARNTMLILDIGGPNFKIDMLEDLHVNRGPNGMGIQNNGQRIMKYEYVMVGGMQRRNREQHHLVMNLPTS
jgi:hypothetical protein